MAITKSREVYGWGNNSFGKLGIRENYETIHTPQRVNLEQGLVVGNFRFDKAIKRERDDKVKRNH